MTITHTDARFWNRIARKYAADKVADEAGYERTLACTRSYLKPTDHVLEFGCGTGTTALRLASQAATYTATDISEEMITIAKEKQSPEGTANLTFLSGNLQSLPLKDEGFDVVLGFNILHLVRDLSADLERVYACLKPDGLFISKTPCLADMNPLIRMAVPLMQAVGQAPHVTVFSSRQLQTAIMQAGFDITEVSGHASKGKDTRPFIVARKS